MVELRPAFRAAAGHERLLEAALSEFAEKRFHGTTTHAIAAMAGISPAGLYIHHRSKEELSCSTS